MHAFWLLPLIAFVLMPIGHGCSITHRHHPDEEDEEPFSRLLDSPTGGLPSQPPLPQETKPSRRPEGNRDVVKQR